MTVNYLQKQLIYCSNFIFRVLKWSDHFWAGSLFLFYFNPRGLFSAGDAAAVLTHFIIHWFIIRAAAIRSVYRGYHGNHTAAGTTHVVDVTFSLVKQTLEVNSVVTEVKIPCGLSADLQRSPCTADIIRHRAELQCLMIMWWKCFVWKCEQNIRINVKVNEYYHLRVLVITAVKVLLLQKRMSVTEILLIY